jgi:uncharacterized protein YceK
MKIFNIIVIALLFSGCASINMHEKNSGHVFMGIRSNVHGVKCAWSAAAHEVDNTPRYLWSPLALAVSFILFVDMPLEFVADMAYLPKDIVAEPANFETALPSDCGFSNYTGHK